MSSITGSTNTNNDSSVSSDVIIVSPEIVEIKAESLIIEDGLIHLGKNSIVDTETQGFFCERKSSSGLVKYCGVFHKNGIFYVCDDFTSEPINGTTTNELISRLSKMVAGSLQINNTTLNGSSSVATFTLPPLPSLSNLVLTSTPQGVMSWVAQTGTGGGTTYNQSLNSTDIVTFASLNVTNGIVANTITCNGPFASTNYLGNKKVVLYDTFANEHQFFGLGVGAYTFRYQTPTSSDFHTWYCGLTPTTSKQLMKLSGAGLLEMVNCSLGVGTGKIFLTYNSPNNYTLTFPSSLPSNGQVLSSDAGGNLSWSNLITGPQGPQGIQGIQGIQGPAGPAGSGTGTTYNQSLNTTDSPQFQNLILNNLSVGSTSLRTSLQDNFQEDNFDYYGYLLSKTLQKTATGYQYYDDANSSGYSAMITGFRNTHFCNYNPWTDGKSESTGILGWKPRTINEVYGDAILSLCNDTVALGRVVGILNNQPQFPLDVNGLTKSVGLLLSPSNNSTHGIALYAPSMGTRINYTLPSSHGTNGQVLTENGSGGLTWTSISTSGSDQTLNKSSSVNFSTLGINNANISSLTPFTVNLADNSHYISLYNAGVNILMNADTSTNTFSIYNDPLNPSQILSLNNSLLLTGTDASLSGNLSLTGGVYMPNLAGKPFNIVNDALFGGKVGTLKTISKTSWQYYDSGSSSVENGYSFNSYNGGSINFYAKQKTTISEGLQSVASPEVMSSLRMTLDGTGLLNFYSNGGTTPTCKIDSTLGYAQFISLMTTSLTVTNTLNTGTYGTFGAAYIGSYNTGGDPTLLEIRHKNLSSIGSFALLQGQAGDTVFNCASGRTLTFAVGNSAKMTLNSSGYVGLGTTNPSQQLQLSTDLAYKLTTSTWNTSSDQRVKTNIVDANLDILYNNCKNLKLHYYTWDPNYIDSRDKSCVGWIAQEVELVYPKAVNTQSMTFKEDIDSKYEGLTIPDFKTLNIDELMKCNFGATQKLIQKVEALEEQNTLLKNQLAQEKSINDQQVLLINSIMSRLSALESK